ncbi:MAG: hypothetical protein WA658_12665, partial [Candidatus Acidiferrales bacterium]
QGTHKPHHCFAKHVYPPLAVNYPEIIEQQHGATEHCDRCAKLRIEPASTMQSALRESALWTREKHNLKPTQREKSPLDGKLDMPSARDCQEARMGKRTFLRIFTKN